MEMSGFEVSIFYIYIKRTSNMDTFRIDTLLEQNNMTFTELSTRLGATISRTNLYNFFSDNNKTISILKQTAEVLNVNVSDLFAKTEAEIVHGYLEIDGINEIYIISNLIDLQRFNVMLEDYLNAKNNSETE